MLNTIFHELRDTLRLWRLAAFISASDTRARYRRTVLGPLWIVIGLASGSLGLGLLWSELWNMPPEQIVPSITIGFLVWIFISSTILEGSQILIIEANMIQNTRAPLLFYSLVTLTKQWINFLHSLLIVLAVSALYPPTSLSNIIWVFPGLLVTTLFLFFSVSLLSILCARFRDIQPLLNSIMPMLFFLSPVLFRIEQAKNISWLIWINPFTYFIIIVREPLQGSRPEPFVMLAACGLTLLVFMFLAAVLNRKKNQVVYWV